MPRAPAQKHNHLSPNAGHPYALPADSNSSDPAPTSIHSPQPQKYFQVDQHSQTHLDSLPPSSTLYQHQQGQVQHYRYDDAGPSVKQQSPRDTSRLQAQSSGARSESNQGKQQHRVNQEGVTKSTNDSISPATESSRAQPNGAASPSDPNSASSSALTKTLGQASGGTATKKKHVCQTCDRAFTTSGHLARHARVHTGERNHKCPFPGCETRCSRQDNLQQHYRIHLSPGSRRSSSSATRAAIRGAIANPTAAPSAISTATATDLDAPPPLAQATFPAAHIAHPGQYASGAHQPYPVSGQTSTLPQSHVPSPHITQQPYHSHTPPIPNGAGHAYENSTGNGLTGADVARGYAHGPPESPSARSGPGSATPSADASPIIGGLGTSSQPYAGQQQTYIYVQHPGYYQSAAQHPSPSPQTCGSSAAVYSTPPPPASTNLDGQYQPQTQPQISTFYQPHHYPREAYIHSAASASPAQATQTPPNCAAQQPLPQQTHDHRQGYAEPPKAKSKRRGHATRTTSGGSMVNGAEQSPTDSPAVVANVLQGRAAANGNHRANGQGQSNVYAFYGMAAPPPPSSSASHPPPPPSSDSIGGPPPPPPSSSHGGTRYTVTSNGSGFGQFQVHTSSAIPPPLTTSSTATSSSYTSAHYGQAMDASNANGTHSPPPVLAPIQTKRPSYHEALPRYSYAQHTNSASYASVGKGYPE